MTDGNTADALARLVTESARLAVAHERRIQQVEARCARLERAIRAQAFRPSDKLVTGLEVLGSSHD